MADPDLEISEEGMALSKMFSSSGGFGGLGHVGLGFASNIRLDPCPDPLLQPRTNTERYNVVFSEVLLHVTPNSVTERINNRSTVWPLLCVLKTFQLLPDANLSRLLRSQVYILL